MAENPESSDDRQYADFELDRNGGSLERGKVEYFDLLNSGKVLFPETPEEVKWFEEWEHTITETENCYYNDSYCSGIVLFDISSDKYLCSTCREASGCVKDTPLDVDGDNSFLEK